MRTMDHKLVRRTGIAALSALALAGGPAGAAVSSYQQQADFDAAVAALGDTHLSDFESIAVATSYAAGSGPAGAHFVLGSSTYAPGDRPTVQTGLWTSSGERFLGLNNGDQQFSNGDTLSFTLSGPVRAFGLYVIVGADVLAGDLRLNTAGGSVSNAGSTTVGDGAGSFAYFLGLVSSSNIASVTLEFGTPGDPSFLFNAAVDDVRLIDAAAVPEPSRLALTGLGGLALLLAARRRAAKEVRS
ncbi:PEP-CTERM sorting domain-containing protein [Roseateles violae]|uniref:PEP-CTERM sorting domain-containing protein n=1 Tax=Roseateles violae TaxID=3058042 RepID=A0ABT8DRX9_9BURK|nr:PEP-CTERM sorting domain-containing protein [Pelomonas sp. PFR6]MDN3920813.1 PEP-CTERM sorting domain-containing protein [Pelomonas sp. PFR6]